MMMVLLCVLPVLEVQQVTFVSRTVILCRSLWQFMQQVDSTRGIFFLVCLKVGSCIFLSPECKLLAVGGKSPLFRSSIPVPKGF